MKSLNAKNGFTMIELIFVIVILGLLAAVAIPKLSATRDDANLVKKISNTKVCISDVSNHYTAMGTMPILANLKSCTSAMSDSVSIEISGNDLIVSSSGSVELDGTHPIGGTRVSF